jgi:CRISPR/Cas system CSM-associated protein Csm3 (group 7 of RAMP superfamily)
MSDPEITYGPYRLEVRGELKLLTPMHIGSGERLGVVTDDPVVRFANQPDGTPFIPGSSLRGVLRSRLEREQTQIRVASNYFRTFFLRRGTGREQQ